MTIKEKKQLYKLLSQYSFENCRDVDLIHEAKISIYEDLKESIFREIIFRE